MYVADLGNERLAREVKRGHGYVSSTEVVDALEKNGVLWVSIDTEKGPDIEEDPRPPAQQAQAAPPKALPTPTTFAHEAAQAKRTHARAMALIRNVLGDVKMGVSINTGETTEVAGDIVSSIFRNQNALSCLGMIRHKDNYLMEHSINLAVLIGIFGKHLGLDRGYIREMVIGAFLHDVGKVMIPDEILNKPGKLSNDEFIIMKTHAAHSRDVLKSIPGISRIALETAAQHHEKIDGSGYPDGLTKDNFSVHGRMLAIIDVYDAITADRCYHDRITPQEALRRMLHWTENHLDGELLQAFIKAIGVYPVGSLVCLESGKMGVVLESRPDNTLKPLIKVFYNYIRGHYLAVETLDMTRDDAIDRIVKTEDARNFGIDLHHFMAI